MMLVDIRNIKTLLSPGIRAIFRENDCQCDEGMEYAIRGDKKIFIGWDTIKCFVEDNDYTGVGKYIKGLSEGL